MKHFITGFFCLSILLYLTASGYAFRCGNSLVTSGDTKTKVKVACGKPTSTEKACEGRQTSVGVDKKGKAVKSKKCKNKVEVWYYNCGEDDYIYALTFENGKLKKEDNIGRGKGKSECLGK